MGWSLEAMARGPSRRRRAKRRMSSRRILSRRKGRTTEIRIIGGETGAGIEDELNQEQNETSNANVLVCGYSMCGRRARLWNRGLD